MAKPRLGKNMSPKLVRVAERAHTARYGKALVAINDWCRRHRHDSLAEQRRAQLPAP